MPLHLWQRQPAQRYSLVVALVGMFGVGEVLYQLSERRARNRSFAGDADTSGIIKNLGRWLPTREELRESNLAVFLSCVISTIIGLFRCRR